MKKILVILIATIPLALTAQANTIVFSTFGPGDTYNQNNGYAVGTVGGDTFEQAAQFTAGASGFLATVDLGLTFSQGSIAGPVNAFLYGDAAGSPDNANQILLGSGTPTAEFGSSNNSVVSIAVAGSVPVTLGSVYWLVLKPADPTVYDVWNQSSPVVLGNRDYSKDDSTWTTQNQFLPAFRLTADRTSRVPDSGSTFVLLLGAVAALLVVGRPPWRTPI